MKFIRLSIDCRLILLAFVFISVVIFTAIDMEFDIAHASINTNFVANQNDFTDQTQMDQPAPKDNLEFLFAVFAITWAGFFYYVFIMTRRRRHMQKEIEALKTIVTRKDIPSKK